MRSDIGYDPLAVVIAMHIRGVTNCRGFLRRLWDTCSVCIRNSAILIVLIGGIAGADDTTDSQDEKAAEQTRASRLEFIKASIADLPPALARDAGV